MAITSYGDLPRLVDRQALNAQLRARMEALGRELASGQVSRPGDPATGAHSDVSMLPAAIDRLNALKTGYQEAEFFLTVSQTALSKMSVTTKTLMETAITLRDGGDPRARETLAEQARRGLDVLISALNVGAGGRAVFAGTAVDSKPLPDAGTVISDILTALPPVATTADLEAALDGWFAAGGGFETLTYQGAPDGLTVSGGAGERAQLGVTALGQGARDTLRAFALAVLSDTEPVKSGVADDFGTMTAAIEGAATAMASLSREQGRLGFQEQDIASRKADVTARSERAALERSTRIEADPYRVAAELEQIGSQLEALYAITARLSALSLANYLR